MYNFQTSRVKLTRIALIAFLSLGVACAGDDYRRAAEQRHAEAQHNPVLMYVNGEDVPQDATEAVKWLRRAAEQGLAEAQYNLGVSYARGEGVPQDATEAVKWYRRAAEQGFAEAQYNLGEMYADGRGVPRNNQEAYVWFSLAAAGGSSRGKQLRDATGQQLSSAERTAAQQKATRLLETIHNR